LVWKQGSEELSVVVHACNPSHLGGRDGHCYLKPDWAKSVRPYLKNKVKQKGWGFSSSDRVLAWQEQGPESSVSSNKRWEEEFEGEEK
jgi:hypothetical protein